MHLQWREESGAPAAAALLSFHLAVFQLVRSSAADVSSNPTIWTPTTSDLSPIAPVNYQFGEDFICPVLTTSSSAVLVQSNVTNTNQVFMVDLPQAVPLELFQRAGPCERCHSLIIMLRSANLTEGEFRVFYDGKVSRICYGPLGLFNPAGGNMLPYNSSNVYRIHYRTLTQENFIVCRNGSLADFQVVSVSALTKCASGTNAGGFSTPFEVTIVYIGSESIIGLNFTITSSQSCEDPYSGNTFTFIISDPPTTMPTTAPTPASPVTPTSSLGTTLPTSVSPVTPATSFGSTLPPNSSSTTGASHPSSSNTVIIVVSVVVPTVIVLVVLVVITVLYKASRTIRKWFTTMETNTGKKLDSMEQKTGDRLDSMEQKTGERFDSMEQKTGNRLDLMEKKTDDRFDAVDGRLDSIEQKTDERFDSMEQKTGERFDSMEQKTGKRFDSIEQKTGERFDSMEQKTGKRFDSMEQKTGERFDSMEQKTGDRLDAVDGKLDSMDGRLMSIEHTGAITNKNTDHKLNYIIDDLAMKDIYPQDSGEDLTESRQRIQQLTHKILDQNNNQEVCSSSHTSELNPNTPQKALKTSTQLKGIITTRVSSHASSNGYVTTSTHKDKHKSNK